MLLSFALLSTLPTLLLAAPQSLTIYSAAVPSAVKPAPFLQLTYDPSTLAATVESYTPPKDSNAQTPINSLHRIGIYDAESSWHGVVTSSASFAEQYKKHIKLYVDEKGEVFHVGFSTSGRGAKPDAARKATSAADEEVVIEIVSRNPGPEAYLNKPVKLSPEGKMEEKEPEKSFLQK